MPEFNAVFTVYVPYNVLALQSTVNDLTVVILEVVSNEPQLFVALKSTVIVPFAFAARLAVAEVA